MGNVISLREIFFSIIRLHSMQIGLLWPKANGSREIVLPIAPFSGRGGRGVRGDKCPISKTVLRIQHPLPLIPNPSPRTTGEKGARIYSFEWTDIANARRFSICLDSLGCRQPTGLDRVGKSRQTACDAIVVWLSLCCTSRSSSNLAAFQLPACK